MMKTRLFCLVTTLSALVAAAGPAPAPAAPAPNPVVAKLTAAAGGAAAESMRGVFKLEVATEETTLDGESHKGSFTAWINPASWIQRRVQITSTVVLGFDGRKGWATINGKMDQRPQTPRQASSTINRLLFTLTLPFSLEAPGIRFGEVRKATWDGKPAVKLTANFPQHFFYSPVMDVQWTLFLDPSGKKVLGAEFMPSEEYFELGAEGIRYRILKRDTVEGVTFPVKVLAVGLDENGAELGHVKTYSVKVTRVPGDASLFLSPEALEAIGETSG